MRCSKQLPTTSPWLHVQAELYSCRGRLHSHTWLVELVAFSGRTSELRETVRNSPALSPWSCCWWTAAANHSRQAARQSPPLYLSMPVLQHRRQRSSDYTPPTETHADNHTVNHTHSGSNGATSFQSTLQCCTNVQKDDKIKPDKTCLKV